MNKDDKILVTGGTGLIGSYLLRKLVDTGFINLYAINLPNSRFDLVSDIKDKITWQEADITNVVELNDVFDDVHTVIHCAGMISLWPKEFKEMYRVNVDGSALIVNLCLEHQVSQLVYLSSIEALGREEDNSMISEKTEWKEDINHTKYASSKYLGELEAWRGIAEGLDVIIYNPALVLGAGYWDTGPMQLIRDIFNGLKYYPRGKMAMVDVRDLVKTIVDNLGNEIMFGNRYIVGGHNVSFKHLLHLIADKLNVPKPNIALSGMTAHLAINIERVRSLFTDSKPLINKESYLITDKELSYSFDKINAIYQQQPKDLEESISDITSVFESTYKVGKGYGVLKN